LLLRRQVWLPSLPLRALTTKLPASIVSYVSGVDLAAAAAAAKGADVAVIFGYQHESEGMDLKSLDLGEEQDKLIETVAAASPQTIVVLETGSPATMPWIDHVAAVVEAWYPGIRGAEVLANLLTGEANFTGKTAGDTTSVSFTVRNTGKCVGTEIAQVYASLPDAANEPPKRLIGWARVELAPGESKQVSVPVDRDRLTIYDEASDSWKLVPGNYTLMVGGSSQDLPLHQQTALR
jgi:hypothetical protein